MLAHLRHAMALHLSSGKVLSLRQPGPILIGRADQQHIDVHTSRQHCSLELLCQGINEEVLKITSLSKAAPTQVYRAGASDPEILCTGQHALLRHDDRFSTGAALESARVDLQLGAGFPAPPKPSLSLTLPTAAHATPISHDSEGAQLTTRSPAALQPPQPPQHSQAQQAALCGALAVCPPHQAGEGVPCSFEPDLRDLDQLRRQQQEQQQQQQQQQQQLGCATRQEPGMEQEGGTVRSKRRRASDSPAPAEVMMAEAGACSPRAAASAGVSGDLCGAEHRAACDSTCAEVVAGGAALQRTQSRPRTSGTAGTGAAGAASAGAASASTGDRAAAGGAGARAAGPRESPARAGQPSGTARPLLLILMGINGSGKSTFSQALVQGSTLPFVRVNQDTIRRDGTPGTRKQCVTAARNALMSGKSVVVDRCNLNEDQRKDFIAIAAQFEAPVYAVILDLPFEVCLERAMGRTSHPSGKLGRNMVPIVYQMQREWQNGSCPSAREGVSGVTICKTDAEIADALQAWQKYDGGRDPPARPPPDPGSMRAVQAGSGGRGARLGLSPPKDSGKRGGKRAPPPASSASVDLMRTLFSRPQAAGVRPPTTSPARPPACTDTAAGVTGQGNPPAAASLTPPPRTDPAASLPNHSLALPIARSHSDSEVAAAQGSAAAAVPGAAPGIAQPVLTRQPSSGRKKASRVWNHFQQALYYMAIDPSTIDRSKQGDVHVDHLCIRIRDIYPKGQFHALVVAREDGLDSIADLQPRHLPLLGHMRTVALQYVWHCQQLQPRQRLVFRLGFHTIPSCRQLHLHVISQDLSGANMKRKDHFQCFTTPFFITLDQVEQQLQQQGYVDCDQAKANGYLETPLKCHRCNAGMVNFPRLRDHLASCAAPFVGAGAVTAPDVAPVLP